MVLKKLRDFTKKKQHELTWKAIHTDEREMGKMVERK